MRFDKPVFKRLFAKLIHDVVPGALASLLGGLLITHFQLNRVPEPASLPAQVAPASAEMMQLLRDEHGLISSYVSAKVAAEKRQIEADNAEKRQIEADNVRNAAEVQPVVAAELQPVGSAEPSPRAIAVAALKPPAPVAPRVKPAVVGASLPALPAAAPQANEPATPVAQSDDSLLSKTISVTQRAVSAIGGIPSWIGSIGDRIGGQDPAPRPPADLMSAS